ncbi:MAG: hypothetical protein P4M14_07590 [Gammaproteobacteria bacterium]|nr:hypothetical protein [Gammaproteobacteria bacterium]
MSRSSSSMPASANPSYKEEMSDLLYKPNEKPSSLKPRVRQLIADKHPINGDQQSGPFAELEKQLYVDRKTQQMLLLAICSRSHDGLDAIYAAQAINLPLNVAYPDTLNGRQKAAELNTAIANFKARYIEDYTRALALTRTTIADITRLESQNNSSMSKEAIYLWQAFSHAEEELSDYQTLKNKIALLLTGNNKVAMEQYATRIIDLFKKLYQLKDELQKLDLVGLYVYRSNQHLRSKNSRSIAYKPDWKEGGDPLAVTGFAAATTDYRNQFKRITLLQTLNKSSAFDTYSSLTSLLSLEEKLNIHPALTQAVSPDITQHILSWANESIYTMTHKIIVGHEMEINGQKVILAAKDGALGSNEYPDLEHTLVGFSTLVEAEQSLKETFRLAESIIQATVHSKGNIEATLAITAEDFTSSFKASNHKPLSHAEVQARDRKRQKELEQLRRQEREVQDKLMLAHSFTQQLAKENMQKAEEMKQLQKDALLSKITSLSSHKKRLLIDLLNPDITSHHNFDEKEVISLLADLELSKNTKKGFLIQTKSAPAAASSSAAAPTSAASTHRDHSDGKLDANFVENIRQVFSSLDISVAALETQFKPSSNTFSK